MLQMESGVYLVSCFCEDMQTARTLCIAFLTDWSL